MPPRIGMPLCLDASGSIRAGRRYHYIDTAYARAVSEAGAVPLYLPAPGPPEALCQGVDGLLLPGGDDFLPDRPYPEGVSFSPAAPEQIAFDASLLAAALARRLPVLGICYGMQLLALHRGGRLLHHIPTDEPEAGLHALPEPDGRHGLRVAAGSRLAAILGEQPPPVNSLHRQGVREPGRGLRVSAWADDGLIEALEAEGPDFVVAVQWHPEKMEGLHRKRLFGAFVDACRPPAGGRPSTLRSDRLHGV